MSLYLPNPCLLGIFLAISTYDGPQLVFHYPPKPNAYGYKATPMAQEKAYSSHPGIPDTASMSSDSDADTSSSDDEDDDDDEAEDMTDDAVSDSGTRFHSHRTDSFNTRRSTDTDDNNEYLSGKALLDILDEQDRRRKKKQNKQKKLMKNIMLSNVGEDTLDSTNNNNSSQISSNHASQKKQRDSVSHTTSYTNNKVEKLSSLTKLFGFETDFLTELITPSKSLCNTRFEVTIDDMSFLGLPIHVYDDGKWKMSNGTRTKNSKKHSKKSYNDHEDKNSSDEEGNDADVEQESHQGAKDDKCPMNMFHLVFAMNPPLVEYNHRIDEMYHYIISRLTLVLRYEQHKSNFIYNESMKIFNMKEENLDLSVNELWFKIIQECSLANIIFQTFQSVSNNDIVNVDINGKIRSFQIPLKNEFSSLPPNTVSILRGSYLSSINPLFDNSVNEDNSSILQHFALLLLDDPETIIRDIQAEKDSIIANFIKLIKPTESLNKLSTISGLDLNQIFSFSFHLVLWRRAIAIPPLQGRNVYIVSPLAPMQNVVRDAEAFKLQFQSLPSLHVFLSMLSQHAKPRPYSMLLPSRDHRELYLEALGWLIKSGYALQLHTFLWLKITNKIKVAVDEEIEMENFKKRENRRAENGGGNSNGTSNTNVKKQGEKGEKLMTDNLIDNKSHDNMDSRDEPQSAADYKAKKIVIVEEEDTILLDPERATALERRWITKIIEGKPPEVTTLFYRLLKYFNGKEALELLLIRENISRADIKKLFSSIDQYIVSVKHW